MADTDDGRWESAWHRYYSEEIEKGDDHATALAIAAIRSIQDGQLDVAFKLSVVLLWLTR